MKKLEFKLNEFHRDLSKEELIDDLRTVAKGLNLNYVSRSVYEKTGKYSATPFLSNFGSWINALKNAGLEITRDTKDYKKISESELINSVREVSKYLSKDSITTSEYKKYGKYSISIILDRFSSWEKVLKEANLKETGFIKKIESEDLLQEIERLWIKMGRQPTSSDIKNGISKYSLNSFTRRYGSWRNSLETFINYINEDDIKEEEISNNPIKTVTKEKNIVIKTRRTPRDINQRLRFKVLQRDHFKCVYCGRSPATDPAVVLHVDHIIPWSKGGETVIENLQTLCSKCNLGKSDLT
jgi:hypothetical protein